ncbi:hypothetical protein DFJ63DRAFT_315751 [Scheffersomyces coipomensis]|uniref:uncharacterized protein n=1 Tax=Scheffersomyces coipomensis TaxID=1788519 RepID=UPI00315C9D83
MSDKVPAWKRIGLKLKQELEVDPLAISQHVSDSNLTTNQIKKLNKQKRQLETNKKDDKKPPKRVKLPKSERPEPPVKDQLTYLRQFSNDRENWKFSKQKQNWILKNIKDIPSSYEPDLIKYLEGLQGGSRSRVVEDMKKTIQVWNLSVEEVEAKIEQEINSKLHPETKVQENESDKVTKEDNKTNRKESKEIKQEVKPDKSSVLRFKRILSVLTDEEIEVKGVEASEITNDDAAEEEEEEEEETNDVESEEDNLIVEEVDVD